MKSILTLFWQICLLRRSPAFVPTQGPFVVLVVTANIVCSTLLTLGLDGEVVLAQALSSILVGQATTAALVLLALSVKNLAERFVTTITAWFGCDLIITACFALVLPLSSMLGQQVVSVVFLMFLVWSVAVTGFIMHRALEVPLAIGIGIGMAISLLGVAMSQLAAGA